MEFRPITLLAFAIIIVTTVNCNSEGDVLYNFRSLLSDPNNVLQSWDPTLVNPCTWFHVTCNNNNSVIRVDLGSAVLSGPLPPSLGELKNLQYFELYNNNLTGRIPEELGNLQKLVSLDLYSNQLSGSIPLSLGKLKNLRYLRLQENNLTGTIPKQVIDLVSLGNLRIMNVSINFLDGTIRRSKGKDFISTTIVQDPKVPK